MPTIVSLPWGLLASNVCLYKDCPSSFPRLRLRRLYSIRIPTVEGEPSGEPHVLTPSMLEWLSMWLGFLPPLHRVMTSCLMTDQVFFSYSPWKTTIFAFIRTVACRSFTSKSLCLSRPPEHYSRHFAVVGGSPLHGNRYFAGPPDTLNFEIALIEEVSFSHLKGV